MTHSSTFWCSRKLRVSVQGPDGDRSIAIDKPYARIGAHRTSDVVLAGPGVPARALYVHATDQGVFAVNLAPPGAAGGHVRGWLPAGDSFPVGPYRLLVEADAPLAKGGRAADDDRPDWELPGTVGRASPVLSIGHQGTELGRVQLNRRLTLLGRNEPSTLRVTSHLVSGCHAALYWDGAALWVVDLCSRNGVWYGEEMVELVRLSSGDAVRLGNAVELSLVGFIQARSPAAIAAAPAGEADGASAAEPPVEEAGGGAAIVGAPPWEATETSDHPGAAPPAGEEDEAMRDKTRAGAARPESGGSAARGAVRPPHHDVPRKEPRRQVEFPAPAGSTPEALEAAWQQMLEDMRTREAALDEERHQFERSRAAWREQQAAREAAFAEQSALAAQNAGEAERLEEELQAQRARGEEACRRQETEREALDALRSRLEADRGELDRLATELAEREATLSAAEESLRSAEAEFERAREATLRETEESLRIEREQLDAERRALGEARARLAETQEALDRRQQEWEAAEATGRSELAELERRRRSLEEAETALAAEREAVVLARREFEKAAAKREEALTARQSAVERQEADCRARRAELDGEQSACQESRERLEAERARLEEERGDLAEERRMLELQTDGSESGQAALDEGLAERRAELLAENRAALERDRHHLECDRKALEQDREAIRRQRAELAEYREDLQQLRQELQRLREELTAERDGARNSGPEGKAAPRPRHVPSERAVAAEEHAWETVDRRAEHDPAGEVPLPVPPPTTHTVPAEEDESASEFSDQVLYRISRSRRGWFSRWFGG